ncbi:uncharacterized protein LOC124208046 isoform X2 [Daphnia pulex]|uniref:uncharacterized protein LOC124208046 isoform X2 n=1 Tax=Daphnia pulex TaxID=6669 RepID=UPI001EDF8E52|nr:uncharacterized protein LOC124208046 isoform X2 [Daphnia pulex]
MEVSIRGDSMCISGFVSRQIWLVVFVFWLLPLFPYNVESNCSMGQWFIPAFYGCNCWIIYWTIYGTIRLPGFCWM